MVDVAGIEPATPACKADALPAELHVPVVTGSENTEVPIISCEHGGYHDELSFRRPFCLVASCFGTRAALQVEIRRRLPSWNRTAASP
jgi:hypothetical protein